MFAALATQGLDFRSDLQAAIRNQTLGPEALSEVQRTKFRRVWQNAAHTNAVYIDFVQRASGIDVGSQVPSDPTDMPPLDKNELARIAAETPPRVSFRRPILKRTSGSSGRPLTLWKQRSGLSQELAATWSSYGWYGVYPGDRHVKIWGRPLDWRKRTLNTVTGFIMNSRRVSAFDVTPRALDIRLSILEDFRPTFVYGYASALRSLAHHAMENGTILAPSIRAVISTAEPLDERSRSSITSGFSAPCFDEYGSSEVGSIAHECTFGRFHIMADNLLAEVLVEDGTVKREGFGELLVTDLTNELTPVIRYRVGDYCELNIAAECPCGLTYPAISNILGRVEDEVVLPDGRRQHPAMMCYLVDKADTAFGVIEQYQVVQRSINEFEIRIVSTKDFSLSAFQNAAQAVFKDSLRAEVDVKVIQVASIEREPSGKFRIVVGLGRETV
jgi:phenylacetate-CoA ligase